MTAFASHMEVADNEFVETIGIEFDDLSPGLVIEHRPGFTFSWAEARDRARRAGDHSPIAIDAEFAALAGGGRAAIPEAWLVGAMAARTTRAFGRVVANLAWEGIEFPDPLEDGDTVYAESRILGRRESRSRPEQGVLHVATRGIVRGSGAVVCTYERKLLVYRSASGPHLSAGYV